MKTNNYHAVGAEKFNAAVRKHFPQTEQKRIDKSKRVWTMIMWDSDGKYDNLPEVEYEPREGK